jgi:hypothetical protein
MSKRRKLYCSKKEMNAGYKGLILEILRTGIEILKNGSEEERRIEREKFVDSGNVYFFSELLGISRGCMEQRIKNPFPVKEENEIVDFPIPYYLFNAYPDGRNRSRF